MAEENWLRVAIIAMALGVGLYLIPLGMIARPDLIRLAEAPGAELLFRRLGGRRVHRRTLRAHRRADAILQGCRIGAGYGPDLRNRKRITSQIPTNTC